MPLFSYVTKKHVILGDKTNIVANLQESMYNSEISGWVEHPPKPHISGLSSLKDLHELDMKLVVTFRRLHSYQVPRTFMDGELNAECQALWSRMQHDRIGRFDTVTCIPVGSCAEGGVLCRSYSSDPDGGLMDFDQLHVLGNLCFADYDNTFGPAPDQPGWYWVKKEAMCSQLTNSDEYVNICSNPRARPLNVHFGNATLEHYMKRSGPALTEMINMFDHTDNSEYKLSLDTVIACQLDFWPPEAAGWLTRTRQWPSQDVVDQISQQPCFLVHKPPSTRPEDMDKWSLSFTLAEQMLCLRRSEGMKLTYFCFKAIFYKCLHVTVDDTELSSYLCKTVMMWALEELPPGQWTEKNLLTNLLFLFSKLNGHIECKHLPHYFIPELNVMRNVPESMFSIIRERIYSYNLLSDISMACPDLSDNEVSDFITHIQYQANVMNKLSIIADFAMDTMGWKPSNNHGDQEIIVKDLDEDFRISIFMVAVFQMFDIIKKPYNPVNIPLMEEFPTKREYIKHLINRSCHDVLTYLETKLQNMECMLHANKDTHQTIAGDTVYIHT